MNIPTLKDLGRELLALSCLWIAAYIGSLNYETDSWLWFSQNVNFRPDLIAGLVALGLVVPIARGDLLHNHKLDVLNFITACIAFYVTAIFVRIGLGPAKGLLSAPTTFFALAVLVVINLNPKKYGELAIIGLLLCGVLNLTHANKALDIWGFFLVLSAAAGIVLLIDVGKLKTAIIPRGFQKEEGKS